MKNLVEQLQKTECANINKIFFITLPSNVEQVVIPNNDGSIDVYINKLKMSQKEMS